LRAVEAGIDLVGEEVRSAPCRPVGLAFRHRASHGPASCSKMVFLNYSQPRSIGYWRGEAMANQDGAPIDCSGDPPGRRS